MFSFTKIQQTVSDLLTPLNKLGYTAKIAGIAALMSVAQPSVVKASNAQTPTPDKNTPGEVAKNLINLPANKAGLNNGQIVDRLMAQSKNQRQGFELAEAALAHFNINIYSLTGNRSANFDLTTLAGARPFGKWQKQFAEAAAFEKKFGVKLADVIAALKLDEAAPEAKPQTTPGIEPTTGMTCTQVITKLMRSAPESCKTERQKYNFAAKVLGYHGINIDKLVSKANKGKSFDDFAKNPSEAQPLNSYQKTTAEEFAKLFEISPEEALKKACSKDAEPEKTVETPEETTAQGKEKTEAGKISLEIPGEVSTAAKATTKTDKTETEESKEEEAKTAAPKTEKKAEAVVEAAKPVVKADIMALDCLNDLTTQKAITKIMLSAPESCKTSTEKYNFADDFLACYGINIHHLVRNASSKNANFEDHLATENQAARKLTASQAKMTAEEFAKKYGISLEEARTSALRKEVKSKKVSEAKPRPANGTAAAKAPAPRTQAPANASAQATGFAVTKQTASDSFMRESRELSTTLPDGTTYEYMRTNAFGPAIGATKRLRILKTGTQVLPDGRRKPVFEVFGVGLDINSRDRARLNRIHPASHIRN